VTKELVLYTNVGYINAESVCQLLLDLTATAGGLPITVVLDNARYQRCKRVLEYAQQINIELLFLPTYSPNLNLIERLWKFVKKESLYSRYYETFVDFKAAIMECLMQTQGLHKNDLATLLTLNFQTFK
jgi:transposase